MDADVPAGTSTPFHDTTSKPFTPASATVGRSGAEGKRRDVVTASARSLPLFT